MKNHWASEAIKFVVKKELFNGISVSRFGPDETMTRGMLVTVLWRLDNKPAAGNATDFADVDINAYYAEAVAWANARNIVLGKSKTEFAPNELVTREQIAAIMYRYAKYKEYDTSKTADLDKFNDADKVSGYVVKALMWANAAGLINGRANKNLDPQSDATRAEVAAIMQRFVNLY